MYVYTHTHTHTHTHTQLVGIQRINYYGGHITPNVTSAILPLYIGSGNIAKGGWKYCKSQKTQDKVMFSSHNRCVTCMIYQTYCCLNKTCIITKSVDITRQMEDISQIPIPRGRTTGSVKS